MPLNLGAAIKPSLLLFSLLMSLNAGAVTVQELTTGIISESKGLFDPYSVTADYRGSTDLNQDKSPRTYNHKVGLSVLRPFLNKYSWTLSMGVDFSSLGGDITRATSQDEYITFGDVGFSVVRSKPLDDGMNSIAGIVATDFLVSEESRFRGYRSVTTAQGILTTTFYPWLSVKNSVSAGYLWNRYRFSPVTTGKTKAGDVNPDGFYSYRFSPILRLGKAVRFTPSLTVRGTHFMDGTNTYDFGNSYTLSYSARTWSTYLKYINLGYADRGETNVWFVDQYRGLLELGLTYNF